MPSDLCAPLRSDPRDPGAPTNQRKNGRSSTVANLAQAAGTVLWPASGSSLRLITVPLSGDSRGEAHLVRRGRQIRIRPGDPVPFISQKRWPWPP